MLPSPPRPTFILLLITCVFVIVYLLGMLTLGPIKPRIESSLSSSDQSLRLTSNSTFLDRRGSQCAPQQKLVFLKTHKTGSTTLASVIQRYGFTNNLTFLVPRRNHFVNYRKIFTTDKINMSDAGDDGGRRWSFPVGYDILTNHARYCRSEMNKVFHGAKYVTILREPSAQFESAFYYFEIWRKLPRTREPLKLFFEDPRGHFQRVMQTHQYYKDSMHNQHLFDFGMSHEDMEDDAKVRTKIRELDSEFDLVLITEYFDESLLLLRKLLCWRMEDILYLSKGTRSLNYHAEVSEELRAKILSWNRADDMLYKHFNESFWRRVKQYGPTFQRDLAAFRQRLAETYDACCNKTRSNSRDRRVVLFSLSDSASDWCRHLARGDVDFTNLIRERMKSQRLPLYDNREHRNWKKRNVTI